MLVKTQVKYIQSLGQKKFRDTTNEFVAEGTKIINELLVSPNVGLTGLFATAEWINEHSSQVSLVPPHLVHQVRQSTFDSLSRLKTPGQVLGVFKKPVFEPESPQNSVSLILDEIQDPGNLGSIIRTADWFFIKKIFCSRGCADAFNPKVIQATMGSIARVEVVYGDPESILDDHRDLPAYAAVLDGPDIFQQRSIEAGFIIIGNESRGIRPELLSKRVHKVSIPGRRRAESLNASVAAGIIMALLVGRPEKG